MSREKDGKVASSEHKMSKMLPLALMVFSMCSLFFYLGTIFCSDKDLGSWNIESRSAESNIESNCRPRIHVTDFEACNISLQDYTPCTDPTVRLHLIISSHLLHSCIWDLGVFYTPLWARNTTRSMVAVFFSFPWLDATLGNLMG